METNKVYALLKAVETGSLSAAARELEYTQSALTHMMSSLEDELGLTLLARGKTGVKLSPNGKELLHHMEALVESSARLEAAAESIRQRNHSTFKVGAYTSAARHWLPTIISDFKNLSPETDLLYMSMNDVKETYNAVKNEELDCAIAGYRKELINGLSFVPLKDDELIAILPGSYSSEEGAFPVEYFSGMDFLMPGGGFDLDILPIFSPLSSAKLPSFRYTNFDDFAIVSMISHGLGVSIMSRLVMRGIQENVSCVPLDPPAVRQLGIIVKEKRSGEKRIKSFVTSAQSSLEGL